MSRHGCLLLEIGHQHGSLFDVEGVRAISKRVKVRFFDFRLRFRRGDRCIGSSRGRSLALIACVSSLRFALKWNAAIFGVDSSVVSKE
jgi:hypothetical protein